MKKYEEPKIEVIDLAKYDVIMSSGSDAGSDWGGSGEEEIV